MWAGTCWGGGHPPRCPAGSCVSVLSSAQFHVFMTLSHIPLASFVAVTCVSVVSFLASCQGMTRYIVCVKPPLACCDLTLCRG